MSEQFTFDESFTRDNVPGLGEFMLLKMQEPNRGAEAAKQMYKEFATNGTIKDARRVIPILRGLSDGPSAEMPLYETIIAAFLLLFFMPLFFIWQSVVEE